MSIRILTKRDWFALRLTLTLSEEIVYRGADALNTFIDALVEDRLRARLVTPREEPAK